MRLCDRVLFVLHKLTHSSNEHGQPFSGGRCLMFGRIRHLLPYFMCANSEGSARELLESLNCMWSRCKKMYVYILNKFVPSM